MRWLYGNTEVVAPISAPMLQMVAIPAHNRASRWQKRRTWCMSQTAKTQNRKTYWSVIKWGPYWPVQEMESTPGPWYSTMAPVPPFTVRMPATFKMTSLGEVQPDRVPVSFTPITFEEERRKTTMVTAEEKIRKSSGWRCQERTVKEHSDNKMCAKIFFC